MKQKTTLHLDEHVFSFTNFNNAGAISQPKTAWEYTGYKRHSLASMLLFSSNIRSSHNMK